MIFSLTGCTPKNVFFTPFEIANSIIGGKAAAEEKKLDEMLSILPEASAFEKQDLEAKGILEVYKAVNNVGYIFYVGDNKTEIIINFDNEGKICDIKALKCSKDIKDSKWFWEQMIGLDEKLENGINVDFFSRRKEKESEKIFSFINIAMEVFESEISNKQNSLVNFKDITEIDLKHKDILAAYKSDEEVILLTEGEGFGIRGEYYASGETIKAYVSFDNLGFITNVIFDATSETVGLGDKICSSDYVSSFIGINQTENVDLIANVTYSSKGAIEAVDKAINAYNELFLTN